LIVGMVKSMENVENKNNKSQNNKRRVGTDNEKIAASHLVSCGYSIIEVNYRYGKYGEIDIIARENGYLCFVEVKSRSSYLFGSPAEAVNRKKQDTIKKIAYIYIKQHKLHNESIRFDIVELIFDKKDLSPKEINIIKNAF